MPLLARTVISVVLATLVSYVLNRSWTFKIRHGKGLIVDAMSSFGAIDIDVRRQPIDAIIGATILALAVIIALLVLAWGAFAATSARAPSARNIRQRR